MLCVRVFLFFDGELVNQHTPKWGWKEWEEEEPWGSNYQGMSIHNKKGFWKNESVTFSAIWNRPTQSQPSRRRTGGPFFHANPFPDVPEECQRHPVTDMRLEPLRSTAAGSRFLWLMYPAINWISMFWIGRKRYLLAPFRGADSWHLLSLIMASCSGDYILSEEDMWARKSLPQWESPRPVSIWKTGIRTQLKACFK